MQTIIKSACRLIFEGENLKPLVSWYRSCR